MNSDRIVKVHCNRCCGITNHRVVADHTVCGSIEEFAGGESAEPICPDEADWSEQYEMLQCCGCNEICVRHTSIFVPVDQENVYFYPPRVFRRQPEWRDLLPVAVRSLVNEVYTALAADSRRLSVMGARTLVDMVVADQVGDVGTFGQKLEALEASGYIGKRNREHLAAALDAGNAAAHRGHVPSVEAVMQVMDIVENLLQAVYVLGNSADNVRAETPPRKPSKE